MNQQRWLDAVGRFQEKQTQERRQAAEAAQTEAQAVEELTVEQEQKRRQDEAYVRTATLELYNFMSSDDGRAARELLAASERHIVIAEENEGGGSGVVYFLDGNGLQQSGEAMGMWMAYAKKDDIPKLRISPVSADEAVMLAIRQGAKPEQIVERIRQKLDRLADEVL